MSKLFKSFLSLLFLSLLSVSILQATTTTWLGGIGKWHTAANWDTGVVPTIADDVIIPSGTAKITKSSIAFAKSVEVIGSAKLYIYKAATLNISGAKNKSGLKNSGKVYVIGNIFIDDVGHTDSSFNSDGIYNSSKIYTYANSVITIDDIDGTGIYNNGTGYFNALGEINISIFEERGIYNGDRFFNKGTININNGSGDANVGIFNQDDFRNNLGGDIFISTLTLTGIVNFSVLSSFKNNGTVNIDNVYAGVSNIGTLTNIADATIFIDYTDKAINNHSTGSIINYGVIKTEYSEIVGLANFGVIENHDYIQLYNTQSSAGLHNYDGGYISNFGRIIFSGSGAKDVINGGIITSYSGAYFGVTKQIDIESTGYFTNDGFLPSFYDGLHNVDAGGSFFNGGVIDDDHNSTDGVVTNQKVIVARVAGTMTVGVPFPNVLDVVSTTGLDFHTWYTSQPSSGGVIAGTYNEVTNEFTPNAATVGLSKLYVSIEDVASGFTRLFTLEIDGGIVPFNGEDTPQFFQNNEPGFSNFEKEVVDVFPNPTTGVFQIKSELFKNTATQIDVFNSIGQLILREEISKGAQSSTINFSDQLASGIYFIKIIQNGKSIKTKRIYLQR